MSKIKVPNQGETILNWAKDTTREVNSLQPTAGQGMKITKTNAGTSYSVDKSFMSFPDSAPGIVGGDVSSDLSNSFATTYSLEKNPQNSFSMFDFSKGEKTSYDISSLVSVDMLIRDSNINAILSSPTLRYSNIYDIISTAIFGDGKNSSEVLPISSLLLSGVTSTLYSIDSLSWGYNGYDDSDEAKLYGNVSQLNFVNGLLVGVGLNVSSIVIAEAVAEQV